jgi:hypothetical protein
VPDSAFHLDFTFTFLRRWASSVLALDCNLREIAVIQSLSSEKTMSDGRRYRLRSATISVSLQKPTTVLIPKGAVVQVVKSRLEAPKSRMAEIRWEGQTLLLFVEDIQNRSDEVPEFILGK